jgi:unsaturated rhamnogalacturonyl hydrolase
MMRKTFFLMTALCLFLTGAAQEKPHSSLPDPVKHSIVKWAFRMPLDYIMEQAKPLDITAFEMIPPEKWKEVQANGCEVLVACGADMGPERGFSNKDFHPQLIQNYKKLIPMAAKAGIKYIICYSGIDYEGDFQRSLDNCTGGLKAIMRSAEKNGVTIIMELLSSKEGKANYFKYSYPGYVASSAKIGAMICDRVNSPNLKLLYDIWQMYDSGADIFSDIEQYHSYIAHYHISGIKNPHQAPTANEPLDFKAVTGTIYSTGYAGYIGHEYMIEKGIPEKLDDVAEILSIGNRKQYDVPFEVNSWADSLLSYATLNYMPAHKYHWNWREATFLRAMIAVYEDPRLRDFALDYIRSAMDHVKEKAHAVHPNAVASAMGLAFLGREAEHPEEYLALAERLYEQYMKIPRAANGACSHRPNVVEIWDDTIFMIDEFLLEMYKTTGDEKYINEAIDQLLAHAEKLADNQTGLWFHGWAESRQIDDDGCCQLGWNNNIGQRNSEFWGRGNGWVAMSMADILEVIPQSHRAYQQVLSLYQGQMAALKRLQYPQSGHWLQLPLHTEKSGLGNFIESSCTAMFGYAIAKGINFKLLPRQEYEPVVNNAMKGLQKLSTARTGRYISPKNVCAGTCIGDENYYYRREVVNGTHYALGAYLLFSAEMNKLNDPGNNSFY